MKNYLEEKEIILMPSPREGGMIEKKGHIAWFMMEGATVSFCLPRTQRGDLVDIFESKEEREFFEKEIGVDLNTKKDKSFFEDFYVTVTKDPSLMHKGFKFNLNDPIDNLRYRVVKANPIVAPSWEERLNRNEYRWALVDNSELNKKEEKNADASMDFWLTIGKVIDDVPKLRKYLEVFLSATNSKKKVPTDAKQSFLKTELSKIAESKEDLKKFMEVVTDNLFESRVLAIQAKEAGLITREGIQEYKFAGEEVSYQFDEIAAKLKEYKDDDSDEYHRIKLQVEKFYE